MALYVQQNPRHDDLILMCHEGVESVMTCLLEAAECPFRNEWISRDMSGQGSAA